MRVGLFVTCFNDTLFPEVGRATVTILERLGVDVDFPDTQTCCGQMHFNSGYRPECVPLVRRFADSFAGYDAVVTPSASCAAMIRHYHPTVAALGGGDLPARVAATPPVHELTEFLTDVLGVADVGASFPYQVAFHPTCHSRRLLGVGDRPERLLRAVTGLTLTEVPGAEQCCGFGGTFAVKNADTSLAMGRDKTAAVRRTGAPVLTAADTSCLMHIGGLLSREGGGPRVMHLAEILASTGPAPTGPASGGPAPTGPAPTGPAPTGPAPTDPAPTGPAPTGPAPTDPAPTGPAPTGPAPTDPAPGGPASGSTASGGAR